MTTSSAFNRFQIDRARVYTAMETRVHIAYIVGLRTIKMK